MATVDAPPPQHDAVRLPSNLGRRRRRPQPSSCASPPRQQYVVIVRSGDDASGGVDSPACGLLCKVTRVPIRCAHPSSSPTGQAELHERYLCLCEETNETRVDISSQKEGGQRCDEGPRRFEEALSHFPNSYSILHPSNEAGGSVDCRNAPTEDCITFLQRCVARWHSRQYPNKVRGSDGRRTNISRGDVAQLYQSLAPNVRWQYAHRHHCTCRNECCAADAIMDALGMVDDASNLSGSELPPLQSQSLRGAKEGASLRLVIAESHRRETFDDGSVRDTPDASGNEVISLASGMILLSSSRKVPLVSITLHPGGDDASAGNDINSDALLRACVKRLLVGRFLLHYEGRSQRKKKEDETGHATLSIRCRLSVKVPQSPSPGNEGKFRVLEFRVGDVQSSGSQPSFEDRHDESFTLFVVLPSTRILFQCEEQVTTHSTEQGTQSPSDAQSDAQIPPLPSCKDRSRVPPHQHLVESLRAIIYFQTDRGRPPVPRSFLLSGPPGVGKTYSVKKAVDITNTWSSNESAAETERNPVHLISLRGSELLATASSSGGNHASAARELERQFRSAVGANANAVIVFLDECDALVSSPIVAATLAVILDRIEGVVGPYQGRGEWERILVVAATNRVDAIPAFLRRPGRLEKEVVVSPPDAEERFHLLKNLMGPSESTAASELGIDDEGLQKVAEACVGYVAADLSALVRRAAILCIERQFHDPMSLPELGKHPTISTTDLFLAMNDVGASCLRDASLSAPPKTTWDDIAGDAGGAKRAMREAIEWPRTRRSAFQALGLAPPRGVLLHGPPGCAKTTLARAAAGAAGLAFLSLSPADVYSSSYVGEAEGVVRRAFDLARAAAPCVLFFDEIDAIIGNDNEGGEGGHGMGRGVSAEARVLSTFLNEMDGVDGSVDDGVLVLAATNRPFLLDAAILRPGRFDRVIYVPPPDGVGRRAILLMECQKWHAALSAYIHDKTNPSPVVTDQPSDGLEAYFDLDMLASDTVSGSMTGAEIVGACREAAVKVMQRLLGNLAGADATICKQRGESLLQALMEELESTLQRKTPLLSDALVLDQYTRFENEQSNAQRKSTSSA